MENRRNDDVARIAEVMCRALTHGRGGLDEEPPSIVDDYFRMAQAAIKAIKEPVDMPDEERKQRPWRFEGEWIWCMEDIEDAIKLQIEMHPDDCGSHTIHVHAYEEEFRPILANLADAAVDYVLENPHLYGLQKKPEEGAVSLKILPLQECLGTFSRPAKS